MVIQSYQRFCAPATGLAVLRFLNHFVIIVGSVLVFALGFSFLGCWLRDGFFTSSFAALRLTWHFGQCQPSDRETRSRVIGGWLPTVLGTEEIVDHLGLCSR